MEASGRGLAQCWMCHYFDTEVEGYKLHSQNVSPSEPNLVIKYHTMPKKTRPSPPSP